VSVFLHFLNTVLIFALLATGLNLVAGTGGMLNLSHAALAGVGAYTAVLLVMKAQWPWLAAFLAGGLLAAITGLVIGAVTLRLRGDYFALATLGFGVVAHALFNNWISLTRGPMGIPGVPAPSLLGLTLRSPAAQAAYIAVVLALAFLTARRLARSPWGRALRAIRDDQFAALALGKPALRFKVEAITIAGFFAGLAGAAQGFYIRFIDPQQFGLNLMISILVAVLFGGLGNYWGSLLGALMYVGLQHALSYIGLPPHLVGSGQQAILSVILLLLMIFRPKGLLPEPPLTRPAKAGEAG